MDSTGRCPYLSLIVSQKYAARALYKWILLCAAIIALPAVGIGSPLGPELQEAIDFLQAMSLDHELIAQLERTRAQQDERGTLDGEECGWATDQARYEACVKYVRSIRLCLKAVGEEGIGHVLYGDPSYEEERRQKEAVLALAKFSVNPHAVGVYDIRDALIVYLTTKGFLREGEIARAEESGDEQAEYLLRTLASEYAYQVRLYSLWEVTPGPLSRRQLKDLHREAVNDLLEIYEAEEACRDRRWADCAKRQRDVYRKLSRSLDDMLEEIELAELYISADERDNLSERLEEQRKEYGETLATVALGLVRLGLLVDDGERISAADRFPDTETAWIPRLEGFAEFAERLAEFLNPFRRGGSRRASQDGTVGSRFHRPGAGEEAEEARGLIFNGLLNSWRRGRLW